MNFNVEINSSKKEDEPNKISYDQINNNNNNSNNNNNENNNSINPAKTEKITITNFYKKASHPLICVLTFIFKLLAYFIFIIVAFFTDKKSIIYLLIILCGAVDFWIVKNISGRKLVGLRWWNEIKSNGEEVWIFESKNEKIESTADKTVFWFCLYINALVWLIFFICELISFSLTWATIALIMLVFGVTNLYGYFKCSKDQQGKLKNIGGKLAVKGVKKGIKAGMENAQ